MRSLHLTYRFIALPFIFGLIFAGCDSPSGPTLPPAGDMGSSANTVRIIAPANNSVLTSLMMPMAMRVMGFSFKFKLPLKPPGTARFK